MKKQIEKTKIRNQLFAYSKEYELSMNEISAMIGVSTATISNVTNKKWELVSDEMLRKIWHSVKPIFDNWNIVSTANLQVVQAMCRDAASEKKFLGLIGYTGAGKTTAIKLFQKENRNVYHISCKKSMTSKKFLQAIVKQLGIHFSGTKAELIEKISDVLMTKENPLLIIDEAGLLRPTMLEYVREIRDNTDNNTGVVLAGPEYFCENVQKWVKRGVVGMPELYSRIMSWEVLQRPNKRELRAICENNGIVDKEKQKQLCKVQNFRSLYNGIIQERFKSTSN